MLLEFRGFVFLSFFALEFLKTPTQSEEEKIISRLLVSISPRAIDLVFKNI